MFGFVPVKVKSHGPGLDQRKILNGLTHHPPTTTTTTQFCLQFPQYIGSPGSVYNLNLGIGKDYIWDGRTTKCSTTNCCLHLVDRFFIALSVLIDLFSRTDFSDCRKEENVGKFLNFNSIWRRKIPKVKYTGSNWGRADF